MPQTWTKGSTLYVMIGLECYGVISRRQESIEEWVHEFTESTLNRVLHRMRIPNNDFFLKTKGDRGLHLWMSHLITSMVSESHIESIAGIITTYTGEQFSDMILKEFLT